MTTPRMITAAGTTWPERYTFSPALQVGNLLFIAGTTAVEIGVGGAGGKSGGTLGWIAWKSRRATVSLHFVVAQAAVPEIEIPYRNVRRTRNGRVKLLAPLGVPRHRSPSIIRHADTPVRLCVGPTRPCQKQCKDREKEAATENETGSYPADHIYSLPSNV